MIGRRHGVRQEEQIGELPGILRAAVQLPFRGHGDLHSLIEDRLLRAHHGSSHGFIMIGLL